MVVVAHATTVHRREKPGLSLGRGIHHSARVEWRRMRQQAASQMCSTRDPRVPPGSASLEGSRAQHPVAATSTHPGSRSGQEVCPISVQPEQRQVKLLWRSQCPASKPPAQASRSKRGANVALPTAAPTALCFTTAERHLHMRPTLPASAKEREK